VNRSSASFDNLFRHWFVLVLVIGGLYVIWLNTAPFALGTGLFPAALVFLVRVIVVWVALRTLSEFENPENLYAWRILVVGLLIWLIVDVFAVLEWSITGTLSAPPTIRDLLRLAGYLAVGYALVSFPMTHPERFGRVREALDVLILVLAVIALAWMTFFRATTSSGYINIPRIFWLSINPLLDVILLVFALRQALLRVRIRGSAPFLLIAAAAGISFVSDLGASFEGLETPPAASLVQVGWMASIALFGLAIRRSDRAGTQVGLALDHEPIVRLASRMEPLIPVALTYTVVGYLLFDWWFTGVLDWVAVGMSAALVILLFGRQAVIIGQQEMRQFAALVNATGDLAFIAGQDGSLQMANPALKNVLAGKPDSELPDLSSFIELSADNNLNHINLLEQAAQKGWSGEVTLLTTASNQMPVLLSLDPVVSARTGEVMIAGTAHDLSPIRRREDDLRVALQEVDAARSELKTLNAELESKVEDRTRELEQTVADLARLNEELTTLDQLKSEFVALVSHELRSPLTNIRSGIELVLEADPNLSSSTHESLALVEAETRRLSQFVETILDISALEAGKFYIEKQRFRIEEALDSACRRLSPQLKDRELIRDVETDIPVLNTDRSAIESVFYHLLDNTCKYAPDGEIIVRIRVEDRLLKISITDEGPGIPANQHDRVFEMFHRLDASDAREIYGHGLGLPMVKRLLEALGGDIKIDQSTEQGTTMTFWVPIEES
jgi:signal transduction histidine kinase